MAINPKLLIAAPILQDYFVDNANGAAMANGVITCYQDNSRTTLKNWYYQSGIPGAYTYVPLNNPLTLSAVGTITDPNGQDTIPFFYPYDESSNPANPTPQPYYITVVDSNGQNQFTRQNFPFNPTQSPSLISTPTLKNLISNSVFWRNINSINATTLNLTKTLNSITYYYSVIAPSQHDGFNYQMSDIQYVKNANGGDNDTITFKKFVGNFPDQVVPNDVTSEYYLNFKCTTGTGSATSKFIQIPIQLHVDSLSGYGQGLNQQPAAVVFDAMAASGSPTITASIFQFLGTGVTSVFPVPIQSIALANSWTKYILPTFIPSAQNLTLGTGGDDAIYLLINLPVTTSSNCEINISKPSFYLSSVIPTNDFETYDQVNSIISSPRTGDYRTSLNSYLPGYVAANDQTIGSTASTAIVHDNLTWPLYNLIWNNVTNTWAPVAGGRGADSYSDFNANKAMTLTRNLGRVIAGLNPVLNTPLVFTVNSGVSNTTLNITNPGNIVLNTGTPLLLTTTGSLPNGLLVDTLYFVYNPTASTTAISLATTIENAYLGTLVTFSSNGSGTNSVVNALGVYQGESYHALTVNEMPSHNHTVTSSTPIYNTGGAGGNAVVPVQGNSSTIITYNVSNTGGGAGHITIQPTVYANVFLKL